MRIAKQHRQRPAKRQAEEEEQPSQVGQAAQARARLPGEDPVGNQRQPDDEQDDRPLAQEAEPERQVEDQGPKTRWRRTGCGRFRHAGAAARLAVKLAPGGVQCERGAECQRSVVAGLPQLGDEQPHAAEDDGAGQPQSASAHARSQQVEQHHRGQPRAGARQPDDPLVTPAGEGHERGGRPPRQRRFFQSGPPLDLGHQPVLLIERIERLRRRPLLTLAPELQCAQKPQEDPHREHRGHELRPPATVHRADHPHRSSVHPELPGTFLVPASATPTPEPYRRSSIRAIRFGKAVLRSRMSAG